MAAFMIPMLIGAGMGAIGNRKDPLKGAVLGGAMGAAGGAMAPGLFGGAADPLKAYMTTGGVEGSIVGGGTGGGAGAVGGGLFGNLKDLAGNVTPFANAASAAQQAGLFGQQQMPMQAPAPMPQTGTGSQTLAALAAQGEQSTMQQMQAAEQARKQRRVGLFGGM